MQPIILLGHSECQALCQVFNLFIYVSFTLHGHYTREVLIFTQLTDGQTEAERIAVEGPSRRG